MVGMNNNVETDARPEISPGRDTREEPRWAGLVSGILHPFTLPPVAFLVLYLAAAAGGFSATPGQLTAGLSVAILFASALPLVAMVILARLGVIDSVDVSDRTKRAVPLALSVLSYLIGLGLLVLIGAPLLVQGLMLAYALNTFVAGLITLGWKISVHAIGVATPLVVLTAAVGPAMLPVFALLALIGAARVALDRHSTLQVVAGTLLGILLTTGEVLLLSSLF